MSELSSCIYIYLKKELISYVMKTFTSPTQQSDQKSKK